MSRLISTQSGGVLLVGLKEMDIECESAVKNVRKEEMAKDVKGKIDDYVERSETTEKNSKATD